MTPVFAIVGRPNVGKSTLFNLLTRSRDALVADVPGLTRDRLYGYAEFDNRSFIVIDTGGIEHHATQDIETLMADQTTTAIKEAQVILWLVDARSGLTPTDEKILDELRQFNKTIICVVNKTDGKDPDLACVDFFRLGLQYIFPISAASGKGINALLETALSHCPVSLEEEHAIAEEEESHNIKVAIIGRPNVGKSTLVNRLLGEERVIVYDQPGTTRDSIFIPFERQEKPYLLIDTAGVRRRRSVHEVIEKFSIVKTLRAIEISNVVIFVIDARQGIADQDLNLLDFVIEAGKALVIVVNKWDGMSEDERAFVKKELDRRLRFINFARIHFISALHGSGVGDLFGFIDEAYESATRQLPTHELTELLQKAVETHPPPAVIGRRIKLRYAHAGGQNPPTIVVHGNQTEKLPSSYKRYLANFFQKALNLVGTPINVVLKTSHNPYEDRRQKH
jgi:GTP-binding protein